MRVSLIATPLLLLAGFAGAQTSIDSRGVTSGGTRIDATGVHTTTRTTQTSVATCTHSGARETVISGNDARRVVDCGGGTLALLGNGNTVHATNCRRVSIEGNGNTLNARFAAAGELSVPGNDNTISWLAPAGVKVGVAVVGSRNHVARG